MTQYIWDLFISHASEDKNDVVRPLANMLAEAGLKVWLDESELFLGDSLREKIDEGLSKSQFGLVILSPSFFAKDWPKSELDGLVSMEVGGKKVILPVWHELGFEDIRHYSPTLAGRIAASTKNGLNEVKQKIVQAIEAAGKGQRYEQPIFAGKLTKKVLMTLPEGAIFMNNCVNPVDLSPTVLEQLGPFALRSELWNKLKKVGCDGRQCRIFANWAGYRDYVVLRAMGLS